MTWLLRAPRHQQQALLLTWLSWVFGAMDTMFYALVLAPAMQDVLADASGTSVSGDAIGWYGGLILTIFLLGWGTGGVVFGRIADRIGRKSTLIATLIIYAGATGASAWSSSWEAFAVTRFVTGLGIGGQWAAGAALVAETFPDERRAAAAAFLQSAWGFGFFLAAAVNLLAKDWGWRALFTIGLLPMGLVPFIRHYVSDPEQWLKTRAAGGGIRASDGDGLREIFTPPLLRHTIAGTSLALTAIFGLWGVTNWTPTLIQTLPEIRTMTSTQATEAVSRAVMILNVGALAGYFSFAPLARWLGRRAAFALMCGGSLALVPVSFLPQHSYATLLVLLPVLGFFTKGIFGGFPLYLPELFATRLRATGAGFCFNAGRIIASFSPFLTGVLVSALGTFGRAASVVALIYLLGLGTLPFAPETKDRPLPD
jgi:MFS family permease